MEYIKNALPLFDFNKKSKNIKLFLQILITISKSVEEIHKDPRNVVIGDLNFDNIILDKNFKPYITDSDSFKIDTLLNETNPAIIDLYIKNRGISNIDINKNTDKLSLILCTLYMLFKKHIDEISIYEYDKKAEYLETLKNLREFILEMKKYSYVPEVPYLHELISKNDIESARQIIKVNSKKRMRS